jgi:aliphatic nitrilase
MASSTFGLVRVATVHACAPFLDLGAGVDRTIAFIEEAARGGARLVVFPEAFLPGYPHWIYTHHFRQATPFFTRLFTNSICLPSPQSQAIGEAARRAGVWVCLGVDERDGGTLYNTQAWFAPSGRLVARHRKLQPTNVERTVWGRGDGRDVFVIDAEFATLGGLICFEHSIDLSRYSLAALGEQIHVASWPPIKAPHGHHYSEVLSAAHAISAQTFVIVANGRVSDEVVDQLDSVEPFERLAVGGGMSGFLDPSGSWIGQPHFDDEAVLFCDLDLAQLIGAKFNADAAGHYARPDIFRFDIDRSPQTPLRADAAAAGIVRESRLEESSSRGEDEGTIRGEGARAPDGGVRSLAGREGPR